METQAQQEVWLSGPLPGIPALLQPAAHALVQANKEIIKFTAGLNDTLIWKQPAGLASIAFHLQHITGFLDRLFTYAAGSQLSSGQLSFLANEGVYSPDAVLDTLISDVNRQIAASVTLLGAIDPLILTEPRFVGRKKLPSTVIGLLFHAAEHTMRHTGQILATARILTADSRE